MDEAKMEQLKQAGIEVEDALERFMNNVPMFELFLSKFREEQNFSKMLEAMEQGDARETYNCAHELKGVCANLSMKALYQVVAKQTEALRQGDMAAAKADVPELKQKYAAVQEVLRTL